MKFNNLHETYGLEVHNGNMPCYNGQVLRKWNQLMITQNFEASLHQRLGMYYVLPICRFLKKNSPVSKLQTTGSAIQVWINGIWQRNQSRFECFKVLFTTVSETLYYTGTRLDFAGVSSSLNVSSFLSINSKLWQLLALY